MDDVFIEFSSVRNSLFKLDYSLSVFDDFLGQTINSVKDILYVGGRFSSIEVQYTARVLVARVISKYSTLTSGDFNPDAIKKRYDIKHLALMGHSGGTTGAAAILTLGRTDISCAMLTSGAYGLLQRAQILRAEAGLKQRPGRDTIGLTSPYDLLEHISGIAEDARRSIIVIGNPRDRVTPFSLQRRFVELLNLNGHLAQLMTYSAFPPNFHNLRHNIGLKEAAACAKKAL